MILRVSKQFERLSALLRHLGPLASFYPTQGCPELSYVLAIKVIRVVSILNADKKDDSGSEGDKVGGQAVKEACAVDV